MKLCFKYFMQLLNMEYIDLSCFSVRSSTSLAKRLTFYLKILMNANMKLYMNVNKGKAAMNTHFQPGKRPTRPL